MPSGAHQQMTATSNANGVGCPVGLKVMTPVELTFCVRLLLATAYPATRLPSPGTTSSGREYAMSIVTLVAHLRGSLTPQTIP